MTAMNPTYDVPQRQKKMRVLIVGGTSAIGLELARALSAAGHLVTTTIRPGVARVENPGALTVTEFEYPMQSGNTPQQRHNAIERFVLAQVDAGRDYDLVVHCAGLFIHEPIYRVSQAALEAQMVVNAVGPIALTRAMIEHRVVKPEGHVVFLSSTLTEPLASMEFSAIGKARPQHAVGYGSSKVLLQGLIEYLAPYAMSHGILVNSYTPSLTRSRMTLNRGQLPSLTAGEVLRWLEHPRTPASVTSYAQEQFDRRAAAASMA